MPHVAHPGFAKYRTGEIEFCWHFNQLPNPTHFPAALQVVAGKTALTISFMSKGFPYKDHIAESFIVMVFSVFLTCHFQISRYLQFF